MRRFLPHILIVLSVIGMTVTTSTSFATGKRVRPNIVFIFADDLGYHDLGCYGSDYYKSPNIDKLAKRGMLFSSGYSAAGNCAPSRGCLLSGQYTPRHSVYAVGNTKRGPVNLMRMEPIPNRSGLAKHVISMADALKAAGYVTGIFGKWHLSGPDGCQPGDQGFDVVMNKNYKGVGVRTDPKGIYTITDAACKFMEKNKDRPFFAFVSHNAIHTGLQAKKETLEKFKKADPGKQHNNPLYAACTFDLDDGVGLLMQKLIDLGIEDNTLVIFTSDNGATPVSTQEPLRGAKGSYYEGGVRVPFLAVWPGVIEPGSKCDVPVINIDLYPTFLDAAGAAAPKNHVLDGESIVPLLKGAGKLKRQAIYWHFPGYLDRPVPRGRDPVFRTRPTTVMRKGDWKLHLYHEEWQLDGGRGKLKTNNAVELYNLADDIGERKNLALSQPEKRDELLDDMLAWMKKVDAKMPTVVNKKYDSSKGVGKEKKKKGKGGKKKKTARALYRSMFDDIGVLRCRFVTGREWTPVYSTIFSGRGWAGEMLSRFVYLGRKSSG